MEPSVTGDPRLPEQCSAAEGVQGIWYGGVGIGSLVVPTCPPGLPFVLGMPS